MKAEEKSTGVLLVQKKDCSTPVMLVSKKSSRFVVPLAIWIAVMACKFFSMLVMTTNKDIETSQKFLIWDGQLYLQISKTGYPSSIHFSQRDGLREGARYAFLPLYPLATRFLHFFGIGWDVSAVSISILAGCSFAVAIYHLTLQLGGNGKSASLAVFLASSMPMSVVYLMGYPESLFSLLITLTLLMTLRQRPTGAFTLGTLTALTRPTAILLLPSMLLIALSRRYARTRKRASLAAGGGLLVGAGAWWITVGCVGRRWDALAEVQRIGWGTRLDWGQSLFNLLKEVIKNPDTSSIPACFTIIFIAGYIGITASSFASKTPRWVSILCLSITLAICCESNYWHSKPRLFLELGPLAAWMAIAIERSRILKYPLVICTALVAFFVSCWFDAYMIDVWPYAI